MGMTDLALDTELTGEQRDYLETVKSSSDSLLTVINDILDFSKIEAGKIDLEAVDFNLRDSLESTLKTVALRADEKGLELLCEVAADVPDLVCGDSTRLRQVVINLVGYAIIFTERGEITVRVQVETRDASDCVLHLTVSDTGVGIPEEKRELIFAPFSQADNFHDAKVRRDRLGPHDIDTAGADDGRQDLGRKRGESRKPIPLHGSVWNCGRKGGQNRVDCAAGDFARGARVDCR